MGQNDSGVRPTGDERAARRAGPVEPTAGARAVLRPLPLGDAPITGGLWAQRQRVNRETTIPMGAEQLEAAGSFENFKAASTRQRGTYHGPVFQDGEVYKWLEALAWEQARGEDPRFAAWQREVTGMVRDAQDGDGYLNTFEQVTGDEADRFRDLAFNHEIFNVGALTQAAIAQVRTGHDDGLIGTARRAVAQLGQTFGPGRRDGVCGHPLIELALAELFRLTGDPADLAMARYFTEARGHGILASLGTGRFAGSTYYSDRVPVRETTVPEGHAVRAVYLASGATDLATETGDAGLLAALRGQWQAMTGTKMYLTGGLGARWEGESFGDPFELPGDRAYAETCAAVASVQWAWRLLLATGEAAYADLMERTLYNAVLPGISLSGDRFFYVNPLQLRAGAPAAEDSRVVVNGRQPWFGTSCCPTNVMRTLSSLAHYLTTSSDDGLQLHQYAPMRIRTMVGGEPVALDVTTAYPWDGTVEVEVQSASAAPWTLTLRVPAWAAGAELAVNGRPAGVTAEPGTYAAIRRRWARGDVVTLTLPMAPRLTRADERIDAVRDCAAIERGPLVYCLEQSDQPAGAAVDNVRIEKGTMMSSKQPDLLGGITTVDATGRVSRRPAADTYPPADGRDPEPGDPVTLRAVPYFAWANRGAGAMRVWIPQS
ncbi:MAG TPA: beta-L-arabinofuranosidase domain-containing protein [Streptosporangiaceae bacterium]|nr:beta-L-arabinofuranosidase domain-containing protein [Streptosporangiaceae bacterium]